MDVTDMQKIGIGLAGFGVTFVMLGMVLFFDKGLLAIGNLLFIVGLSLLIGIERTFRFFFQWHKVRGSTLFFGGILVVLFGWPIIGMVIELWGFVMLFGGFIPVVVNFMRHMPVIGTLLTMPGIRQVLDQIAPEHRYPV